MVDYSLEVIAVPVTDVDRAKEFYRRLGWLEDLDYICGDDFRVVHFTPPGSPCSVVFGTGIGDARAGSMENVHLVVRDIEEARADLIGRGVEVSEIFHDAGGVFHHAGTGHRVPGLYPGRLSYGSFASFCDPDGNGYLLQEVTERAASTLAA
jgi:catechol 2,3-dioxygenase-like lactoylglutathione lyase family enzyme